MYFYGLIIPGLITNDEFEIDYVFPNITIVKCPIIILKNHQQYGCTNSLIKPGKEMRNKLKDLGKIYGVKPGFHSIDIYQLVDEYNY